MVDDDDLESVAEAMAVDLLVDERIDRVVLGRMDRGEALAVIA